VLFEYTPTVPVRASCVPLAGHAAWIAALGSGALGGGAIGRGALTCADRTGDAARGFGCAASTVTGGNAVVSGCCGVDVCPGEEDVADGEEGDSCAGKAGADGDSVAACTGGDSSARTSFAPTAASAR